MFESNPKYKEIYDSLYDKFEYPDYQLFYIASFSKKRDSLHMWKYYADGNGYNLGIDIDAIMELNKDRVVSIKRKDMIYETKEQKRLLEDLFTTYEAELSNINSINLEDKTQEEYMMLDKYNDLCISFNLDVFNFEMTFKHPAYRHEEETRLIIGLSPDDIRKIDYFVSKTGVFVEYTSINLDLHSNLKSITMHPVFNELHREGIERYLKSKIHVKDNFPVSSSQVPFRVI